MLNIRLAKNIGFCSGVRRAIDIAEKTLSKNNAKVYSLGQIIHNLEVIKKLEKRNLRIVNSLESIEDSSTVILPSHGFPQKILKLAKKKNLNLIDVTCPYVSSVQKICSKLHMQGLKVIIIGDRKHPEVKALVDLAKGAYVIEDIKDVKENAFLNERIGIISQTTQSKDKFFKIVSKIFKKNTEVKEVHVFNTICLDTVNRQKEVKELSCQVDALLVIGSSISANTKRLLSIGRKLNKRAYLVQSGRAALHKYLNGVKSVGLISGASTPEWLVRKIVESIKK